MFIGNRPPEPTRPEAVCAILLAETVDHLLEQAVEFLHALDVGLLARRMDILKCRAEAYHVEIGVTFGEETTFQAGVYAEYARLSCFAEYGTLIISPPVI